MPNGLTKKQRDFLTIIGNTGVPLEPYMRDEGISPLVFAKWLRSDAFATALFEARTALREMSSLSVEANARKAADMLLDLLGRQEQPEVQRKAAIAILEAGTGPVPESASLAGTEPPCLPTQTVPTSELLTREQQSHILEALSITAPTKQKSGVMTPVVGDTSPDIVGPLPPSE